MSRKVFGYLFHKWYIVLLCAILGASGLFIEKSIITVGTPQSGMFIHTRIIRFEPILYRTAGMSNTEMDLSQEIMKWDVPRVFVKVLNDQFDIEALKCKTMTVQDKYYWVNRHFKLTYISPGIYELSLSFLQNDEKDIHYLEEHRNGLLDAWQDAIGIALKQRGLGDGNVEVLDDSLSIAEHQYDISSKMVIHKYLISGFCVGALMGVALLILFSMKTIA